MLTQLVRSTLDLRYFSKDTRYSTERLANINRAILWAFPYSHITLNARRGGERDLRVAKLLIRKLYIKNREGLWYLCLDSLSHFLIRIRGVTMELLDVLLVVPVCPVSPWHS